MILAVSEVDYRTLVREATRSGRSDERDGLRPVPFRGHGATGCRAGVCRWQSSVSHRATVASRGCRGGGTQVAVRVL